jgi:hypothetical protein
MADATVSCTYISGSRNKRLIQKFVSEVTAVDSFKNGDRIRLK